MTQPKSNKKLFLILFFASIGMFGFGFALVPLYDVLCEQLGINGKTNATAQTYIPTTIDENRLVNIEFMVQKPKHIPWQFSPKEKRIKVKPGELIHTAFIAKNLSNKAMVGQAVPSVAPGQGAAYFNKTECFCFNQQKLQAKSSAELPLIFYIDPNLPTNINTLTLSYTLFDITDKIIEPTPL